MARRLKLLLIEDSEDDAFLLTRQLQKNGFQLEHKRVETADDMREALETEAWDLVITDHSLPSFSSSGAINLLNELALDIPLIILSGNIDQTEAVESMRLGAKDYIMKDDAARLIPAINRELHENILLQEKRKIEAEIKHLAHHDSLTGLINRAEFENRLQRLVDRTKGDSKIHALLYMDLDHFKIVNDTCGHTAGDELLRQLTCRLVMSIRERDTLARIGGDEFCVLLENCSLERAIEIAHQIKDIVKKFRFSWNNRIFKIGISIGVLEIDQHCEAPSALLSAADLACYAAKDRGRDTVQIYQEDDEDMLRRRSEIDWASRIDGAIEADSFELYQQQICPIQNNAESQLHHEILLRLHYDEQLILPDTFIPAAERYFRMVSVDRWVIRQALQKLKSIHDAQMPDEVLYSMAINLSGQSLADPKLFAYIKDIVDHLALNSETICFEITETAAISNLNIAMAFFKSIKELGCKLSLDDFGSGLSSFSYLKNMPVDFLKIDGVFVKNIVHDPMDLSIVEAISQIGHKAGALIIAEFVENTEIKKRLIDIGVDYAQGYGMHKPEPLILTC